jgi:hypothetical protein
VAEQLVRVCDVCGEPASESVTIRAGDRSLLKDLCAKHLGELLTGTRAPRRGRPRSTGAPPRKRSTNTHSQRAAASASRSKRRSSKPTARKASGE